MVNKYLKPQPQIGRKWVRAAQRKARPRPSDEVALEIFNSVHPHTSVVVYGSAGKAEHQLKAFYGHNFEGMEDQAVREKVRSMLVHAYRSEEWRRVVQRRSPGPNLAD